MLASVATGSPDLQMIGLSKVADPTVVIAESVSATAGWDLVEGLSFVDADIRRQT